MTAVTLRTSLTVRVQVELLSHCCCVADVDGCHWLLRRFSFALGHQITSRFAASEDKFRAFYRFGITDGASRSATESVERRFLHTPSPQEVVALSANLAVRGAKLKSCVVLLAVVAEALGSLKFPYVYPDPESRHLRAALAEDSGLESDYILAGCGADELIDLIMRLELHCLWFSL
ncbi:hypothetical protein B296_00017449 [Ensete ventricosum]|uniref:histidinol-phosphate transaminase n=1 Tax=Ensete ventricosum TaxID=4639 RepID=A0A427AGT0_ENSVE|nr:hypothetical protein B296_00017449 [Ensete ventricosum]